MTHITKLQSKPKNTTKLLWLYNADNTKNVYKINLSGCHCTACHYSPYFLAQADVLAPQPELVFTHVLP